MCITDISVGGANLLLDTGRPVPDPHGGLGQQQPPRDTSPRGHLFELAEDDDEIISQMDVETSTVRKSLFVISENFIILQLVLNKSMNERF